MVIEICVNIGSGHGLLPDGTKPLPEPMLTYHHWDSLTISLEVLKISICKMNLKNKFVKSFPYLSGANELMIMDSNDQALLVLYFKWMALLWS